MPRIPGWFPLLLCLLSSCVDRSPVFRATATAEIARQPGDYLNGTARAWQVSRGGVSRGLLWGTLHLSYGSNTQMPGPIRARFYAAADLTVEAVLDEAPDAMHAIYDASRKANLAADRAALQRLDPATRAALDQVPGADMGTLSVRGAASLLAMAAARPYDAAALPENDVVDLNLILFARAQDRPVHGLETPGTVDPTLADPNGPEAAAVFRRLVRQKDDREEFTRWLRTTYGQGDVATAVAGLAAWEADAGDLRLNDRIRDALYTRRNAAWLPQLEARFGEPGDHFVAVGAGHLLGPDGLVALLRARGYQVTPCVHDVCS